MRIAEGLVPPILQGVELLALDLGMLQAGASVKGEFEARLKGVLDEVKSSPKPIIMFIDEAHTLIGAGGAAGQNAAAKKGRGQGPNHDTQSHHGIPSYA